MPKVSPTFQVACAMAKAKHVDADPALSGRLLPSDRVPLTRTISILKPKTSRLNDIGIGSNLGSRSVQTTREAAEPPLVGSPAPVGHNIVLIGAARARSLLSEVASRFFPRWFRAVRVCSSYVRTFRLCPWGFRRRLSQWWTQIAALDAPLSMSQGVKSRREDCFGIRVMSFAPYSSGLAPRQRVMCLRRGWRRGRAGLGRQRPTEAVG